MSATTTVPCDTCGEPVTREQLPDGSVFAKLAAKLPAVCDRCGEAADAEDQERRAQEDEQAQQARIADRAKRSGLPAKYRERFLADLDHPSDVLFALANWHTNGGGLLLTGEIGRGKTTLAGAACWHRLQRTFVQWVSTPLLFARLGSGLGTEQRDWALDILSSKHALVLDDIDKARPTEYGAEQVFLAVDQRVEHEAPLLVTSNLSPSMLADKWPEPYGPAIASRLVGYCEVVAVKGDDRRLRDGMARAGGPLPKELHAELEPRGFE